MLFYTIAPTLRSAFAVLHLDSMKAGYAHFNESPPFLLKLVCLLLEELLPF